ncbi:hypothetical protein NIES4074_59820 (plasmid) [Cylindrospermum sp. NIES-4074]|nr:hypothetical protein NIES4074_59820 [Cylindrospermum sp. NIES-4074]
MSAIINNYRQLDVAFLMLNDLTTKLRTAGARISVRKVGNVHRVTVLKEPTVASIEQILSYTSGEAETPNLSNSDAITSSTERTSSPNETPSETIGDTVPAVSEEIGENSVADAIASPTSPESTSSPEDTPSEAADSTVTAVSEEIEESTLPEAIAIPDTIVAIEDNSVPKAIAQSALPETIAPPTSFEFTSQLDDSHSVDSNNMIACNTAELIVASSDSSTPVNSSSEITNIPNSPELASLEDLQPLTLKRLKELAKFHKIPGFSRMKEEKLVTKLYGLATKEQIL